MRLKAILGFMLLVFFFGVGGIYIAVNNARVIDNLEKVLALHQMGFFRDNLLNRVRIMQADLYLAVSTAPKSGILSSTARRWLWPEKVASNVTTAKPRWNG